MTAKLFVRSLSSEYGGREDQGFISRSLLIDNNDHLALVGKFDLSLDGSYLGSFSTNNWSLELVVVESISSELKTLALRHALQLAFDFYRAELVALSIPLLDAKLLEVVSDFLFEEVSPSLHLLSVKEWQNPKNANNRVGVQRQSQSRMLLDEALSRLTWENPSTVISAVLSHFDETHLGNTREASKTNSIQQKKIQQDFKRAALRRSISFGWLQRLIISRALVDITSDSSKVLELYFQPIIERRDEFVEIFGQEAAEPDLFASWVEDPVRRATSNRDRRENYSAEVPASDQCPRHTVTYGNKYVDESPRGSDRDNFMCAAFGILRKAKTSLMSNSDFFRWWKAEFQNAHSEWEEVAAVARSKGSSIQDTLSIDSIANDESGDEGGDVLDGLSVDNMDTVFHELALFPEALWNAVRNSHDQSRQWSLLDLQIEFVKSLDLFEIPVSLRRNRFQTLFGNSPKTDNPMTADDLMISFDSEGELNIRWKDDDLIRPVLPMGGCPAVSPLPTLGMKGFVEIVDRLSGLIPDSWLNPVIDVETFVTSSDSRVAMSSGRASFLFAVLFAPLAWSNNPFLEKLTGLAPDKILSSEHLLTKFVEQDLSI